LAKNRRARIVAAPKVLVNDNAAATLASVLEAPFTSVNASDTVSTTSFAGYASAGTTVTVIFNRPVTPVTIVEEQSSLPQPLVLWLYDPCLAPAVGRCGEAFAVYDCVDDYAEQASGARNRALVAAADRRAATDARLVFTTTSALQRRHVLNNPRTHLVRNVGDFAHFSPAALVPRRQDEFASARVS